jgi:glutathione S-transferase
MTQAVPKTMKLHWSPRSPYVRKVMVFAHETGLADRFDKVRSVVAMSKPNLDVMRDNPLGKIPTLVLDNGLALFGSVVICEYLDSLHRGAKLFPASGMDRWRALRWHALGDGMLDTLILWRNERDKPPARQTPEWLSNFELKMTNSLEVIEKEAGDLDRAPIGIGHVGVACALGYLDFRFPDVAWRTNRVQAARWFESFANRPSMRATLPTE